VNILNSSYHRVSHSRPTSDPLRQRLANIETRLSDMEHIADNLDKEFEEARSAFEPLMNVRKRNTRPVGHRYQHAYVVCDDVTVSLLYNNNKQAIAGILLQNTLQLTNRIIIYVIL